MTSSYALGSEGVGSLFPQYVGNTAICTQLEPTNCISARRVVVTSLENNYTVVYIIYVDFVGGFNYTTGIIGIVGKHLKLCLLEKVGIR
jgi:hypothetical protein